MDTEDHGGLTRSRSQRALEQWRSLAGSLHEACMSPPLGQLPRCLARTHPPQLHICFKGLSRKMPITFGSVGDIISLSLLIKDLVKSLDKSRGSSAEYKAVIYGLRSLDHALIEVGALFQSCERTIELNALSATVKECAEQCRKCITEFQGQLKKYEKSLQSDGSGNFIRDTALKVRWQVSMKEDLAKFRADINAICFTINMLLATTGVFAISSDVLTCGLILTLTALSPN